MADACLSGEEHVQVTHAQVTHAQVTHATLTTRTRKGMQEWNQLVRLGQAAAPFSGLEHMCGQAAHARMHACNGALKSMQQKEVLAARRSQMHICKQAL